jgi:Esterase FrsA-like
LASQNNPGITALLKIFGGNIIVSKQKKEILTRITNLTMEDLQTILSKIHSFTSWENEWRNSGENDIKNAEKSREEEKAKIYYQKACAKFYLASLFSSSGLDNVMLFDKLREAYSSYGKLEGKKFEHVSINYQGQHIIGYFQHPDPPHKVPVVLIIPPLGAIKEQLDVVSEYFLKNGMATLRIDVAGFGETTGKLLMVL